MESKRVARRLLRLYPRAWRDRYEDEVLALIDEAGLTTGQALDLLRGAGREWTRLAPRQIRQFILEGVFLPYELRIASGYERFYVWSVVARALAGGLVFAAAGPVGRWLLHVDNGPVVDWALTLAPCAIVVGLYRVWAGPRRRRFTAREDAAFGSELDRYPLPPVNRWLSWAVRRISGKHVPRPLLSMSAAEAAGWILISVVAPAFLGASQFGSTGFGRWQTLYLSFWSGAVITSSLAAVVRRYARSGPRPASAAP